MSIDKNLFIHLIFSPFLWWIWPLCMVAPKQMIIGWGIPAIIVGGLLAFDRNNIIPTVKRNPNFQYGNAQAAISLFVLVISFIGK